MKILVTGASGFHRQLHRRKGTRRGTPSVGAGMRAPAAGNILPTRARASPNWISPTRKCCAPNWPPTTPTSADGTSSCTPPAPRNASTAKTSSAPTPRARALRGPARSWTWCRAASSSSVRSASSALSANNPSGRPRRTTRDLRPHRRKSDRPRSQHGLRRKQAGSRALPQVAAGLPLRHPAPHRRLRPARKRLFRHGAEHQSSTWISAWASARRNHLRLREKTSCRPSMRPWRRTCCGRSSSSATGGCTTARTSATWCATPLGHLFMLRVTARVVPPRRVRRERPHRPLARQDGHAEPRQAPTSRANATGNATSPRHQGIGRHPEYPLDRGVKETIELVQEGRLVADRPGAGCRAKISAKTAV